VTARESGFTAVARPSAPTATCGAFAPLVRYGSLASSHGPPGTGCVNRRYSFDVTFPGFDVNALATWTTNQRGPVAGSSRGR
jgi:hypothetical protein